MTAASRDQPERAPDEKARALSVCLAIATTGRPTILARTLAHLAGLADRPARIVVSVATPEDFDPEALPALPVPFEVLHGEKGASAQRNAVLSGVRRDEVILFLDDDFLIADGYVTALRRLFSEHRDVVMATGRVLADGIHGPGLSHAEGVAVLAAASPAAAAADPQDVFSVYGCNMAIRGTTYLDHPEGFDERLKLYAWLEDMDLSRRMARFGRIVRDERLQGVHLGTKTARSAGLSLGYSQIANPVHLIRKKSVPPAPLLKLMAKNVLANLGKSIRPEPWVDRRGRARGNLLAISDLLRGRIAPERILTLR